MVWQELETTLPRSSKSVATTSWTASKSGKVTQTYTDRSDHSDTRADDDKPIVGHRLLLLRR